MAEETSEERAKTPKEKPVNNATLAAMLKKSAAFVEKGEFDPIMYHALIDFRAYYKQKKSKEER